MKIQVFRTDLSGYQSSQFPELEKKQLQALGPELHYSYPLPEKVPPGPVVLITNSNTQTAKLTAFLPQTKLLIHPNSGYDNLSLEFVEQASFPIVIGHQIRTQAVCDYIMACLIRQVTPLRSEQTWDFERRWSRQRICDLKIAVIGLGHIGKKVATLLKQWGAQLSLYDPYQGETKLPRWEEQDGIIMCASLNPSSRHFLNQHIFSQLKKNVFIINGARGGLIEEPALLEFLRQNPQAYAYLDVFEKEPNDFTQECFRLPNLFLTSHRAGVYRDIDQEILNFEYQVLADFLRLSKEKFAHTYRDEILQNKIQANPRILL